MKNRQEVDKREGRFSNMFPAKSSAEIDWINCFFVHSAQCFIKEQASDWSSIRLNTMLCPRKSSNASACRVSYSFSPRACAWWQQKQQNQIRPWGCAASEPNTPGSRQLWCDAPAFWPGCGPPVLCRAGPGESGCPHFGKGQTGSRPGWLVRSGSRSGSAGSTWMLCSGRRRGWPGWSTG